LKRIKTDQLTPLEALNILDETEEEAERKNRNYNSKHEIRISKQFQMLKIHSKIGDQEGEFGNLIILI